jgi:hypothetical protein
MPEPLLIARAGQTGQTQLGLLPALANRHRLIETMANRAVRSVASRIGLGVIRRMLGSILGGGKLR